VNSAPLRFIDLFAGCGGLTTGFQRESGYEPVAAIELDQFAASSYALNYGEAHLFAGDIADWLDGEVPRADVVIGGPPCQGFSSLGTRNNRDPRNALWRRYVDVLLRVQPAYFVLENVSIFLKSGQFGSLLKETAPSGRLSNYRLEFAVVNAAKFGVPQLRRRAIVIGSLRDLRAPGLPIGQLEGKPAEYRTVRQAIGDVDFEVNGIDLPESVVEVLGETVPGSFKTIDLHLGRRPSSISMERYKHIPEGGSRFDLPDHLLSRCWREHQTGSFDVMGRLHWDRPSVTIRTEFNKPEKGRYLHPEAHRPITHLEAARLQGFPDEYLWAGSKTSIAKQIGNAVPVPLAAALANHIRNQLR
jgi:DNA (cytosine-5)-methyltransferase 1